MTYNLFSLIFLRQQWIRCLYDGQTEGQGNHIASEAECHQRRNGYLSVRSQSYLGKVQKIVQHEGIKHQQ